MNPYIDYEKIPEMRENIKNVIDSCPSPGLVSVMRNIETMNDDQIAAMCGFMLISNDFVHKMTAGIIIDQLREYGNRGMRLTMSDIASLIEMSLK
jgi:hypothetical protein